MPHTVHIEEMTIELNEDTNAIFSKLTKAIQNQGLDAEEGLSKTLEIPKAGLKGRALSLLETLTAKHHGSKILHIAGLELALDPEAKVIYEAYEGEINALLISMGRTAKDCQMKEIDDRFTLTRKILLRIAVKALSVKENDADFGLKMIKVLRDFSGYLNDGNILNHHRKGLLRKEMSVMNIYLATDHNSWINAIQEIVETIRDFHLHHTAISSALTYLDNAKKNLARCIAVILNSKLKSADLDNGWIMGSFLDAETLFIKSNISKSPDKNCLAMPSSEEEKTQRERRWSETKGGGNYKNIINHFNKIKRKTLDKKGDKSAEYHDACEEFSQIEYIYNLFFNTNLLIKTTEEIDKLFRFCGWAPILTGVLKMENLAHRILHHVGEYEKLTNFIKNELKKNTKNDAHLGLLKYLTIPFHRMQALAVVNNLKLLQSPLIRDKILQSLKANLAQLVTLDDELNGVDRQFSLIDRSKLDHFLPALGLQPQPVELPMQLPIVVATRSIENHSISQETHSTRPTKLISTGPQKVRNSDQIRALGVASAALNTHGFMRSYQPKFCLKAPKPENIMLNKPTLLSADPARDLFNNFFGESTDINSRIQAVKKLIAMGPSMIDKDCPLRIVLIITHIIRSNIIDDSLIEKLLSVTKLQRLFSVDPYKIPSPPSFWHSLFPSLSEKEYSLDTVVSYLYISANEDKLIMLIEKIATGCATKGHEERFNSICTLSKAIEEGNSPLPLCLITETLKINIAKYQLASRHETITNDRPSVGWSW